MYSFDGKCTYKLAGDCKENTFSIHQSFDENSNLEVQVIFSLLEILSKNPIFITGRPEPVHGSLIQHISFLMNKNSNLGEVGTMVCIPYATHL